MVFLFSFLFLFFFVLFLLFKKSIKKIKSLVRKTGFLKNNCKILKSNREKSQTTAQS